MASKFYDSGINGIVAQTINWGTDVIKCMLVTPSYTFVQSESSMTNAAAAEVSATGYTAGFSSASRRTLASKTNANDTTNHRTTLDAADPATWTAVASGVTFAALIVYKHLTNDASSTPIAYLDFTDTASNGSDFSTVFDALGIGYIQN